MPVKVRDTNYLLSWCWSRFEETTMCNCLLLICVTLCSVWCLIVFDVFFSIIVWILSVQFDVDFCWLCLRVLWLVVRGFGAGEIVRFESRFMEIRLLIALLGQSHVGPICWIWLLKTCFYLVICLTFAAGSTFTTLFANHCLLLTQLYSQLIVRISFNPYWLQFDSSQLNSQPLLL